MDLVHPNYGVNLEIPQPVKYEYASTAGGPQNEEIRTQAFHRWNTVNISKTYLLFIIIFNKKNIKRNTL